MMTHTILNQRRQAQRLPADSKVARLMAGAPPGEEYTALYNTKSLLLKSLALSLLIISFFLGLTSNSTAQITAGGILDNAYDRNGHPYGLTSLAVNDTIRADTGAFIPSVTCTDNTGYFQVYFEQGSGMENSADNTHLARRAVLCRVLRDLSAFMPSQLTSSDYKMQLLVRAPGSTPGLTGPAFGTSFYIVPNASNLSGRVENVAWSAWHSGKDPWIGISQANFLSAPGALFDGFLTIDFARYNWHTDLSTPPSANEYDQYTYVLKEMTRVFGITSLIAADGSSVLGAARQFYDGFDMRLTTKSGQPLIVATGFTPSTGCMFNPTLNAISVLSPDPSACMSDSTNCDTAIQFVGSVTIPVYTPNCFEPGTSLSSLEDQCSGGGNNNYFVTSNITPKGSMKRSLRSEEQIVLNTIGYATDTVYGDTATLNYSYYGSSRGVGSIVGGVNDGYFGPDSTDTVRITGLLDNDINADAFEDLILLRGNGYFNVLAGNRSTNISYTPGEGDAGLDAAVGSYVAVSLESYDRGPRMFFSFSPSPPPMIICVGSTATVPTCGGTGYGWWITGTPGVATIDYGTGVVTGVHVGSFGYYYGNSSGTHMECSGSGTVVATPDPIVGPSTICPLTFNNWSDPTLGGTWNTSTPLGISGSTTLNPTTALGITGGTAILTYNLMNNPNLSYLGCIATKTITINNVGIISGASVCVGSNQTMTETVSGGTWSVSPTTMATITSGTGILHGVSIGIVTVTYSVTSGGITCRAYYSDSVLPSYPATITGVSPICAGTCATFSASLPGGAWTSHDPSIATAGTTGAFTGSICGISAGTTTITYSYTNSCGTFISTYSVTVIGGAGAVWITGGPGHFCGATSSITLTGHPSGGTWGHSGVCNVTTGGVASVSGSGYGWVTYTVTGGGCSSMAGIPAYPTAATITGPSTICQGQTITLTGTGDGNGDGNTAFTSYSSWTPISTGITSLSGLTHIPTSLPTATTIDVYGVGGGTQTITYTFKDSCGTYTATKNVTVTGNSNTLGGPTTICACLGSTFTWTKTVSGGKWYSSDTSVIHIDSTTGSATIIHNLTAPRYISLWYTYSSGGCTFTAYVSVTVNPCPSTTTVGLTEICEGLNTTYTNATPGGTWTTTGPSLATISANPAVASVYVHATLHGTQTLTYNVTNTWGCTMAASITVQVDPITAGTIALPSLHCIGDAGTCTSSASGGTWSSSVPGVATINSSTGAIHALTAGTTIISYAISNICGNFLAIASVTISPTPYIVGTSVLCANDIDYLMGWPGPGTFSWISGPGSITPSGTISSGWHIVTPTPAYVMFTTTASGCHVNDTLTINPAPILSGTRVLCFPNNGSITDSTGLAGYWTSSNPSVATVSSTGIIYSVGLGTTTITRYLTGTGCHASMVVTVCATPHPTIVSPLPASPLCAGSSTTIHAIPGSTTGSGVHWTSSNTSVATISMTSTGPDTSSAVIYGLDSGVTYITYTDTNSCGCVGSVITTITVNPTPHIIGPTIICMGDTTGVFHETTGETGTWSSSVGTVATIDASTGKITTVSPGVTVITFTNSYGCTRSWTLTVCATPHPTIVGTLPATHLCVGQTTTIHAIPGSSGGAGTGSGYWTTSSGTIASVLVTSPGPDTSTATIYGLDSGIAYITYTYVGSCGCVGYVVDTIIINPRPTISGPWRLCMGDTTGLFMEMTGETGTWSSSVGTVATIGASSGRVYLVGPGTTVITFLNSYGCSYSQTLIVCPTPHPVFAGSYDTSLCVGQSTIIRATPGASGAGGPYGISWISSSTTIASISVGTYGGDTSTVTVHGLDTGTVYITYTVYNNCGCAGTIIATIHVHPNPHISGPAMICYGTTATFTDTWGTPGTWSSSVTSVATIHPTTGVITTVSPGSTVITFTTAFGCTASQNLLVCSQVDAATDDTVKILCKDGTAVIHGWPGTTTASGTYNVSWSTSKSSVASVSMTDAGGATSTATVYGVDTGKAIITFTAISGCSCTGTKIVSITVTAPVITGPSILCMGTTGTFVEHTGVSGTWSSSNTSVATINSTTGVVTPVGPGTTIIKFTSVNGCVVTLTLTICASPKPVVISPYPTTILCVGSTTLIHASPGATESTGPYNVSWSSSAPEIASVSMTDAGGVSSTARVYGVGVGTADITYMVTNPCGCVGIVITRVTISVIPVISGPSVLCMGNTVTFHETTGVSGTWSSSNTSVATINATTGFVTPVHPGTTTISFTSIYGCVTSVTLTVCAWTSPLIINPLPTTTLCVGASTSISASPGANYDQNESFNVSWTSSDPNVAAVSMVSSGGATSSATVTAIGVGTVDITYQSASGCGCNGRVITRFTINSVPAVITGSATTFCAGASLTLSESSTGGTWSSSNNQVAQVNQQGVVSGIAGGTATISYSYPNAQGGCAATFDLTVTERATACVVSGYGQSCNNCWAAIFSGTSQATVTYHVENQQHSVIQGGYTTSANSEIPYSQMPQGTAYIAIDQVSATNCTWQGCGCQGGCSASALGNRGINNGGSGGTTGIGNITMKPNPNKGMFTLTGTIENQAATSIVNIEIVDMLGKVLYSDAIKAENGNITADILLGENIANGVYFLRIKSDDTNTVMRFTLDR